VPESAEVAALARRLPPGFVLGAATAALQVEGAADLRGPCGWDAFAARPGTILDGSDLRVTTDHYHRVAEDVALLAEAGLDGYRFSISWPRVQPGGSGPIDPRGVEFYDRLVDSLLDAGIRPMATLYHWDTPLPLEERGGWLTRDTALRFGEYAAAVGAVLGDRVADWVTLNEPATVVLNGYALGIHAPGKRLLFRAGTAARNLLLAHGHAVAALRSIPVAGRIGITNVHTPVSPATGSGADRRWAGLLDLVHNRQYADPVLLGSSPEVPSDLPLLMRWTLARTTRIPAADLALISQPLDFYGLNYYFPSSVAAGPEPTGASPDGHAEAMKEVPFHLAAITGARTTGFGWPVAPDGLHEVLTGMASRYPRLPPVVVTESGSSWVDEIGPDGAIEDAGRRDYLAAHLEVAADIAAGSIPGVDLQGFYIWSLLDNFEWAAGFTQRFGLVHVDVDTQRRTPKASWHWVRALQQARVSGGAGAGSR
jgi:beta-glucosidase